MLRNLRHIFMQEKRSEAYREAKANDPNGVAAYEKKAATERK